MASLIQTRKPMDITRWRTKFEFRMPKSSPKLKPISKSNRGRRKRWRNFSENTRVQLIKRGALNLMTSQTTRMRSRVKI